VRDNSIFLKVAKLTDQHFLRDLGDGLAPSRKIEWLGVSTLHHHFRALTAMSPLPYQKRLRLHAARERMLIDGLDAAVRHLRSDTRAPTNPIANMVASSPTTYAGYSDLRSPRALFLESVSNQ
jgi:methylphosphotriester-DNA--protein-cysteine methyltransferase